MQPSGSKREGSFGGQEPVEQEMKAASVAGAVEARILAALGRCERAAERLAEASLRHRQLEREARAVLADLDEMLAADGETALG